MNVNGGGPEGRESFVSPLPSAETGSPVLLSRLAEVISKPWNKLTEFLFGNGQPSGFLAPRDNLNDILKGYIPDRKILALAGLVLLTACASVQPAAKATSRPLTENPTPISTIQTETAQPAEPTVTPTPTPFKVFLPKFESGDGTAASPTSAPAKPTAPTATEAATAIVTATAVTPIETPVPTAVPTEKAKKPENILPEYSVFYGQMQEENGTGKGSAIIANIPGYPNQLYTFFEANRSGGGYLRPIDKTDENSLSAAKTTKVTLEDTETLSGRLEKFSADSPTSWVFKLKYYGTGKAALIEAAKKLWAIEIVNDPTLWQKVPEETILAVGFKKIELP